MKKLILSSGETKFIICATGELLEKLQKKIIEKKIDTEVFTFIFTSLTSGNISLNNSWIFALNQTIDANSRDQAIYLYLNYLIEAFFSSHKDGFIAKCKNHDCSRNFELLNFKDSSKELVATLRDEVEIINQDLFREIEYFASSLRKVEMVIWIANGTHELV